MAFQGETFFTADWHDGSANIIKYCNRPFLSVEQMNETLRNNYNSVVTKHDRTFFLGDSVWGHQRYREVFEQLNGQKLVILGNHDNPQSYKKLLIDHTIDGLYKVKSVTIDGDYIFMSHYAHRSWNMSHRGGYHLYGHSHNTLPDYGRSCDVGVDKWGFKPVSWTELKEYFKDRDDTYNNHVRSDYSYQRNNFELYFTEKYLERVKADALVLERIL